MQEVKALAEKIWIYRIRSKNYFSFQLEADNRILQNTLSSTLFVMKLMEFLLSLRSQIAMASLQAIVILILTAVAVCAAYSKEVFYPF